MNNNKNILILTDDREQFYSSTREPCGSMNVDVIQKMLQDLSYLVSIKGFSEINFAKDNYDNFIVLYQSTEDPDLRYKDYIEDVLLGLKISGAKLVPRFEYFRAHHNKVFMEILREKMNYGEHVQSRHFGTVEELAKSQQQFLYPLVVKPGAGSKSKNISLVHDKKQLLQIASKVSRSFTFTNSVRAIKSFLYFKKYKNISNHRRKFIVQEFITKLSGDYKILVYGDRYYVIKRKNRPKDFRASGSGILSFPKNVSNELLNYAQSIFEKSDSPFMGMDIADINGKLYLIEFQFVVMGNYALEKSSFYFKKVLNKWKLLYETPLLENVFVESVDRYLNKINKK